MIIRKVAAGTIFILAASVFLAGCITITTKAGKRADLVLLDKNPLEDITNTRLISGVMVRGRWYSRADLDTMLEEVAKANQ